MTSRWPLTFLLMKNRLLFEDGVNQRRIVEILGVSQSGVSKVLKRFNQREICENERRNGRPKKKLMTVVTGRFYVV